jgi:sugar (pentulose or hexulose) kinase
LSAPEHVLVVDIGKTNGKLALMDTGRLAEIEVLTHPNRVLPGPPYPHADVDGLWAFILDGVRELHARHRVDALVATAHAATAALLDAAGKLALPVLDYEHAGPDREAERYDRLRPPFEETGSPRLPAGLNLGAQLFWQAQAFPEPFDRVATIVTWPQYWAFRLCGVAANEATSLGCHTDLWDPSRRDFSTLVERMGWRQRMAPVRAADALLGAVTPAVAAATGLPPETPVYCGIHDSNASLLPHLCSREAPFAVVSTGTWVIAMAVGGRAGRLDPARDTLINVSAFGDPIPSARFMGGREWSLLMDGRAAQPTAEDRRAVLAGAARLLPAVEPGSGPFAGRRAGWSVPEHELTDGRRAVVVSYYLAMMTSVCLEQIGAQGPTLVEGPFATNDAYCEMLRAATGRPVLATSAGTGTSVGASLLVAPDRRERLRPRDEPTGVAKALAAELGTYAALWRQDVEQTLGAQ